jgi:hypothetical protein
MPAAIMPDSHARRRDDPSECRLGIVVYEPAHPRDAVLVGAAKKLRTKGLRVGGLLQEAEGDESHTELYARDITTGRRVRLFEDRGRKARGCRLDAAGLAEAASWLRTAIDARPDVLFINRFGRQEAVGRGLVDEIAAAIVSDIPVVVPVAAALLPQWRRFAGNESARLGAKSVEQLCQELLTRLSIPVAAGERDAA